MEGFGFLALIALLPTQLGRHFWGRWSMVWGLRVDYLSWVLYATDILVMVVILMWGWRRRKGGVGRMRWGEVAIWSVGGVVLMVNVVQAIRPEVAIYNLYSWLLVLGLAWYVAREETEKWLGWGLTIGLSLNLVLVVLQMVLGHTVGGGWWWLGERTFSLATAGVVKEEILGRWWLGPYGTFSHPNALGGFALVSLVVLGGLRGEVWVRKVGMVVALILVGLSLSRVAWVGLGWWLVGRGVLGGWGWRGVGGEIGGKLGRWGLAGGLVILVVGGSLAVLRFEGEGVSWARRQMLARAAVAIFEEQRWWGVGMGNFVVALAPVLPKRESVYFLQPVHNGWWLILAELGLVGWGWVIFVLVRRLVWSIKHSRSAFFLAFLVTGWLVIWDHYVMTQQQNQLLLGVVLGLLAKNNE